LQSIIPERKTESRSIPEPRIWCCYQNSYLRFIAGKVRRKLRIQVACNPGEQHSKKKVISHLKEIVIETFGALYVFSGQYFRKNGILT
jgi:hypothetical protein